ncbi:MAG: N-acetylmuramoyl-L-alanine amidase [Acidobacteria bacterium]|nr:N-acetylmuramoyl-L-alanine amidase [Acidobacteriota bacterium]
MRWENNDARFPWIGSSLLLLIASCLLQATSAASALGTEEKLEKARAYFQQAQEARQALEITPFEERTRQQYARVIEAFRRVYYTAPAYGNATECLMAIGALNQETGRRWNQLKDFQAAIKAYEFLLREYPGSRYRQEALFTIGRIYREDLQQPEEAVLQFERYLATFPASSQAKEARQAIDDIRSELAAQSDWKESVVTAASVPSTPLESMPKDSSKLIPVTDVRYWGTPTYSRVVIDMEEGTLYETGQLNNPPRLYLDLHGAKISPELSKKTLPVESGLLKSVRTGQFRPDVSRIVLDLAASTEYSIFELPNPYRLVIDIHDRASESGKAEATPLPTKESNIGSARSGSSPTIPEAASSPVVSLVKPARPASNGAHSLTRALGLKIGRIMLDPGHGGHDTGAIGPTGLYEKEIVLDIAQRLGKLLEERLGSEVLYTRQKDVFVPLESRTARANELRADLFVSIHLNSSKSPQARGIETYYLNFTTDQDALEVAARENAVSQETISQLQGLVQKIALADKVDESREFATHIQTALGDNLADGERKPDRGIKKAPFVVLIGANMPSILAEISFLSNPGEEKRLRTPEHRQKIAEALYAGIVAYAETLSGVKVASSDTSTITPR